MTLLENSEDTLFIGIDGGGSKCKAIISNSKGDILGTGLGGPANPFYGLQIAINSIVEASENALVDTGMENKSLSCLVAGIGLAGVNLPELFQKIQDWKHPFAKMYLTTDMDIANIGAHNDQYGAVIIVGTGSCGYVSLPGTKHTFGGYGFPIGDKASGAWIGLKAIEYTLLVLDGFSSDSLLAIKICEFFSVDTGYELSQKFVGQASRQYAKIASLVFECADKGDAKALEIINQGIDYISILAETLIEDSSTRLCMIGGLSKYFLSRLEPKLASYFSEVLDQPEVGAVKFAIQNLEERIPV